MSKNKLYNYFLIQFLKNYLVLLLAFSLILWVTQAVRLLDLITQDGNSIITYIKYSILQFPRIFSKISILFFFIGLFWTILQFEESNELRSIWLIGISKKNLENFLYKVCFLIIILIIILRNFIIPYSNKYSRDLLINTEVESFKNLIKENNFNNPAKNITMYIEKKNTINEYKNIIFFEKNENSSRVIIAKDSFFFSKKENFLVFSEGLIIDHQKDKKPTSAKFDKLSINISSFVKKTTDYYKFSEFLSENLLYKLLYDENLNQKLGSISQLNQRIIYPFFLLILIQVSSFLFYSPVTKLNYFNYKFFIFIYGFILIIGLELFSDLLSKAIIYNILLYFYFLFPYIINKFFLRKINE